MLTIGLDLDEAGRPTAIAVAQTARRRDEWGEEAIRRDVWRLEPLSERPHHEGMERMAQIIDEVTSQDSGEPPTVYANVTGPGKPGLGALRFSGFKPALTPVYLTEGDERVEGNGQVKMGKGWLASRLQELLPTGRLRVLDSARSGAEKLVGELLDYRPGDDPGPLMIALGLAVQGDWRTGWSFVLLGGMGSPNPYRSLRGERVGRSWLDSFC